MNLNHVTDKIPSNSNLVDPRPISWRTKLVTGTQQSAANSCTPGPPKYYLGRITRQWLEGSKTVPRFVTFCAWVIWSFRVSSLIFSMIWLVTYFSMGNLMYVSATPKHQPFRRHMAQRDLVVPTIDICSLHLCGELGDLIFAFLVVIH